MKKSTVLALSALIAMLVSLTANAAPVVIKFATLAPEGTTWMEIMKESAKDIASKSKGAVEFKFYPGGIAGDEPDVLRKMRAGQYHGAGFTGLALGELVPEIRVLELPFFYRNIQELDYVKEKLTSEFEKKLLEKGQVLIGWAEPGLVYVLSQKPVKSANDLRGMKMWAWEGDPLAAALIHSFNITPVNIALPDVLMALSTGMLNAVYAPPMASMALQWHTKVKYMLNEPLTNSTGAVIISKKQWDQISAADQAYIKKSLGGALVKLTAATRKQNDESIAKFKQMGLELVAPTAEGREEMIKAAAAIRPQLVGKLYSADFLKSVEKHIADFRQKSGKK